MKHDSEPYRAAAHSALDLSVFQSSFSCDEAVALIQAVQPLPKSRYLNTHTLSEGRPSDTVLHRDTYETGRSVADPREVGNLRD